MVLGVTFRNEAMSCKSRCSTMPGQLLTAHTEHAAGHHRLDSSLRRTPVEERRIVGHEFAGKREPCDMLPVIADAIRYILEAPLGDEAEPPCGVTLALQLVALTVSHHLALALAKLAQRLDVNAVFSEFLLHHQRLFGCKVTKFPTKAFIARQEKVDKPTRNSLSVNCFLLVTILSETWFSLPTLVVDPAVGVFDVIALDAEGGGVGVGEGEGGNQKEEKFCLFHIAYFDIFKPSLADGVLPL